eukprot:comp6965_c0_seq1/m.2706 comp6965_c0_seq1/g.2706  ORF comp6965_c0_seq1/g.2706 comp6965_c0_seq1/m.2706 type:complete len:338 (-) comp6965_c0_seq1:194-1207(-)
MTSLPPLPPCTDGLAWDLWQSQHLTPCVSVACEAGLFDAVGRTPGITYQELAKDLDVGVRGARALCNVLVAVGLLRRHCNGHHLTPTASTFFDPNKETYWGAMYKMDTCALMRQQLMDALKRDKFIGSAAVWESGQMSEEKAEELSRAFHAHSLPAARGLAHSSLIHSLKITHVLDVGAGSGCFAIALAQSGIKTTVMDLPAVCAVAQKYAEKDNVTLGTYGCDMFREKWPDHIGVDCVFFSNIFHDWTDEQNDSLAKSAFEILPSGGFIALHEMLLNDNEDGPLTAVLFSLHMLLYTKGRQFSFPDLRKTLERAGFVDVKTSPSYGHYSIVYGRKP